ncbi:MAG: potassium channel family protein [bacterium]|nr:MAG: potassium channel family protein [bacterium]
MTYKSLDSNKAKEMIQCGKALAHFNIEEIDISNLILENDVKITDCNIKRLIADNTVFEGKFELSQSCCNNYFLAEENETGYEPAENEVVGKCSFNKATFSQDAAFEESKFSCPVDFSNANFEKGARFNSAHFKDEIHFMNACFDQIPSFEETTFENEINFSGVDFGEEVIFRNSQILGLSDFTEAKFGSAEFQDCTFGDNTFFCLAEFNDWADFSRTTFKGELDFAETLFKNGADFNEAQFKNLARFEKSTFNQDCYFVEASFHQVADFDSITFVEGADFRNCTFADRIEFRHATIKQGSFVNIQCEKLVLLSEIKSQELNFQHARFHDLLDFTRANIKDTIKFDSVLFDKQASFDHSLFGHTSFNQAQFNQNCSFRFVNFNQETTFQRVAFHGEVDFRNAGFDGNVNFYDAKFNYRAYMRNVDFQRLADFRSANFEEKVDFTDAKFHKSVCFEALMAEDVVLNWLQIKGKLINHQQKKFEPTMKEYGLLKTLFEKQNNYKDMDRAYRMFKRMERKSEKLSLTNPLKLLKKLFNFLILDLGSGYGTRPFNIALTTVIIILLFGIFYNFFNDQIIIDTQQSSPIKNLLFCIYFSFLSFVTLGAENLYADYSGWLKYVVAAQAFVGFFLMTLFVVTFTRKVIR